MHYPFELGMDLGLNKFNTAHHVKNIHHCAKGLLPLIMDVLYYTGQQIRDMQAIKQSDINGKIPSITQQKIEARIEIEMDACRKRRLLNSAKAP